MNQLPVVVHQKRWLVCNFVFAFLTLGIGLYELIASIFGLGSNGVDIGAGAMLAIFALLGILTIFVSIIQIVIAFKEKIKVLNFWVWFLPSFVALILQSGVIYFAMVSLLLFLFLLLTRRYVYWKQNQKYDSDFYHYVISYWQGFLTAFLAFCLFIAVVVLVNQRENRIVGFFKTFHHFSFSVLFLTISGIILLISSHFYFREKPKIKGIFLVGIVMFLIIVGLARDIVYFRNSTKVINDTAKEADLSKIEFFVVMKQSTGATSGQYWLLNTTSGEKTMILKIADAFHSSFYRISPDKIWLGFLEGESLVHLVNLETNEQISKNCNVSKYTINGAEWQGNNSYAIATIDNKTCALSTDGKVLTFPDRRVKEDDPTKSIDNINHSPNGEYDIVSTNYGQDKYLSDSDKSVYIPINFDIGSRLKWLNDNQHFVFGGKDGVFLFDTHGNYKKIADSGEPVAIVEK